MRQTKVPQDCRSDSPEELRRLADDKRIQGDTKAQVLLLESAAEIEGGEDAYAAIIEENRMLREKLIRTEDNLQGAYELLRTRRT